jgi:acetyl esterase
LSLDPEARAYLEATADLGLPPLAVQGAVEARRNVARRAPALEGELETVARVEELSVPGPAGPIRTRLYAPSTTAVLPVVAYFHGGGWVTGDLDTHASVGRALANRSVRPPS